VSGTSGTAAPGLRWSEQASISPHRRGIGVIAWAVQRDASRAGAAVTLLRVSSGP